MDDSLKTAVILAAGRGSRLEVITDEIPKCLVEVDGRSLLERMLDQLESIGIETVIIVVGYRAESIHERIGETWGKMSIQYVLNTAWANTNNILSLFLAIDYLNFSFLLLESDLILDDDALAEFGPFNGIGIESFKGHMDGTVVSLSDSGNLSRMYLNSSPDRPKDASNLYKTVNIYSFNIKSFKEFVVPILKDIVHTGRLDVYYEIAFAVAIERKFVSFRTIDFESYKWVEIDNVSDLNRAQFIFSDAESTISND